MTLDTRHTQRSEAKSSEQRAVNAEKRKVNCQCRATRLPPDCHRRRHPVECHRLSESESESEALSISRAETLLLSAPLCFDVSSEVSDTRYSVERLHITLRYCTRTLRYSTFGCKAAPINHREMRGDETRRDHLTGCASASASLMLRYDTLGMMR